ncbi:hypothetical protein, partial [Microbulbifer thermotolerans]
GHLFFVNGKEMTQNSEHYRKSPALYANRIMRKLQILLVIFFLVGCDTFYGISQQSNPFSPFPNMQCVLDSAGAIDGVSYLEYST